MTVDSSFMAAAESRDLKVVILGAERTGKTALVKKVSPSSTFSHHLWSAEHVPAISMFTLRLEHSALVPQHT